MNDLLENLNPPQLQAVKETEGPLIIFAGAGSGKTRVLVHRIAYMIEEQGVAPWSIFAVTFTNRAAAEMRERVEKLLGPKASSVWISTFHSAGVKILRRYGSRIGLSEQFAIYDDANQMTLVKECFNELNLNPKVFNPRNVLACINQAKNKLLAPESYPTDDFFSEKVAAIYELYQKKLQKNEAIDFGDLLSLPVQLFQKHPDLLAEFQKKIGYFLVDEYQDTNHAQYVLVKLLSSVSRNLCVVGDDDQSIYRWRGANIQNILNFEKDFPDALVIKLEQNYRSTKNILQAAHAVVKRLVDRREKELWTENERGENISYHTSLSDLEEAKYVVSEIQKQKESGVAYKDQAIFYRTNAQSRVFEDELRRNKIPYIIYGGMKFYDRAEIKDLISYLCILVNPVDDIRLKRIINTPARGIGKTTLDKLSLFASQHAISLWEALNMAARVSLSRGAVNKINLFLRLMNHLKNEMLQHKASEFLPILAEESGYLKSLQAEATLEAQSRVENIEELVNVLAEFENQNDQFTLNDFLDQVALVSEVETQEDRENSLTLMTLHLAKGLEFDHVYYVGLEEGISPHVRSMDDEEEMAEERRLAYVGITRARKKLVLSNAVKRKVFGQDQMNLSSRFLDDIPTSLIDRSEQKQNFSTDFSALSSRKEKSFFDSSPVRVKSKDDSPFQVGAKVKHPIFGLGTVKNCEGEDLKRKVTVHFQNAGIKKLIAQFSNLVVLN